VSPQFVPVPEEPSVSVPRIFLVSHAKNLPAAVGYVVIVLVSRWPGRSDRLDDCFLHDRRHR
jgi:hypothetical protein